MKVTCNINSCKQKCCKNPVGHFLIFITRIELFGFNERVIEEARGQVKKKLKTRFECIETVAFARKVTAIMFISMKTVILIFIGTHIANGYTYSIYRVMQGQTRTDMDKLGQGMDNQSQAWTDRYK